MTPINRMKPECTLVITAPLREIRGTISAAGKRIERFDRSLAQQ
jgi:hypothetical protein